MLRLAEALERRVLLSGLPAGQELLVNNVTAGDQTQSSVGMDAAGNFVVVWVSPDGSDRGIFARRFNAFGVPQGNQFRVNTHTTGAQYEPSIAMDADGDFVVAWTSALQDGDFQGIYAQRYNALGVAQGSEFRVNTFTTGGQFAPSVAMDSDGDFVVAWNSDSQTSYFWGVYVQRYNAAGVPQGGEMRVNTNGMIYNLDPAVAMDGDGEFIVAWQEQFTYDILARRYNAAGVAQGGEFRVNTFTTGARGATTVAADQAGNFVVAWSGEGAGENKGMFARRYNAAGAAHGDEWRVNTYRIGDQDTPSVAMSPGGSFIITWESWDQDGHAEGVYAQQYDAAGQPRGGEFRVNTYTTSHQSEPSVAMGAAGHAVITWTSLSQDGSEHGIYAQRYAPPTAPLAPPAGTEFRINNVTTGNQFLSSVARDSAGNFVVAWVGGDGSDAGVFARRFDAQGVALGNEFLVNTYTTNWQGNPSVAMNAGGDFIVAWNSLLQDGSGNGVYAQRYNGAGAPQGGEFQVNMYTFGHQRYPSVAMHSNGSFVIAWSSADQDGSLDGIHAIVFNAAGVPQPGEFRVNTFTPLNQSFPSVAMDATGNFVVAWESASQDGSGYGIYAQRHNAAGVRQGSEFRVNTFTTGGQRFPAAAMDADGDFIVTWHGEGPGDAVGVVAQRYNAAGAPQGGKFRVNTFINDFQEWPDVAIGAAGNFVITWTSRNQDGSNRGIYGQQYDAAGTPVGGELRVNTFTLGDQFEPAVAIDADVNIIITWTSEILDGSGWGVFAQRFASAASVTASNFHYATAPHRLGFTFDAAVSASLSADKLIVQNLTTSQTIPSSHFALTYESATNLATFTYTGSAGGVAGVLPDGNYRATLLASGTPLPADHVFDFRFLRADANNDGIVNLTDFNRLAANFGQSPRDFTQGDFNYDGIVNLTDFNILASRFGQALGPSVSGRGATSASNFGSTLIDGDEDDRLGLLN